MASQRLQSFSQCVARLLKHVDALTAHCAETAKALRATAATAAAAKPAAANATPTGTPAAAKPDAPASAPAPAASAAEQLRPLLKQMATALQLDAGTALSLGQEALQLSCPALQMVALGEVNGA